jgi:hypothetical protein
MGGLVSNYEAWIAKFDLTDPGQRVQYEKVISVLKLFSDTKSECYKKLNKLLLAELHSGG